MAKRDGLEIRCQGYRRSRARFRIAREPLAPVEMDLDVAANAHGNPGTGVDAIKAWLDPAPHAEPGGKAVIHRPGQGEGAVGKQITGSKADHPGLGIAIDEEAPWARLVVNAALGEQG